MKKIRLGDICSKQSSKYAQKDLEELRGEYPVYGASGFIKSINTYHQEKDYVAVVKDGAGVGRTMYLPAKSSVIGTLQYLIPKEGVDPKYLYYAVKSRHLEKYCTGATIPHIYFMDYQNEPIVWYDKREQIAIVSILEKVETIIDSRKREIEYLDTIIKSRFIEMFGNPVSNEMCWEQATLSGCIESIENGKSFVCDSVARVGDWPAVLKLSAVTYGYYCPEENKAVLDKNQFIEGAAVRDGDLLFTRKNTPELVGMCAYVYDTPSKLMMPDLIFRLNINQRCNKIFLWKLINHDLFRDCIQAIATGSAKSMSNISKERLLGLKIILPPIELQEQFATFVTRIDKSKVIIQAALDKAQLLFNSLMQKYFG